MNDKKKSNHIGSVFMSVTNGVMQQDYGVRFNSLQILRVGEPIYKAVHVTEETLVDLIAIGDAMRKFASSNSFKVYTFPLTRIASRTKFCCIPVWEINRIYIEVESENRINMNDLIQVDEVMERKMISITKEFLQKVRSPKWDKDRLVLSFSA